MHWNEMTDAERQTSALNARRLAWDGERVTAAVPATLSPGTPLLRVDSPPAVAGVYSVGTAEFGPPLVSGGVSGTLAAAQDASDAAGPATTDACSTLTNAGDLAGKIALIDRGTCFFIDKVKRAQNAGAIAVVVADNEASSPPPGLGGTDASITIPSVRITQADGALLRAQLASGVTASLLIDLSVRSGADAEGRALLFASDPPQPGSTDLPLGRHRVSQPPDGAEHQRRSAPCRRSDASASAGHRLERRRFGRRWSAGQPRQLPGHPEPGSGRFDGDGVGRCLRSDGQRRRPAAWAGPADPTALVGLRLRESEVPPRIAAA
jgi:hypothetical protein